MTEQSRQYQAMAKTASWTMVSRVLGLVRDQLTTAIFGAGAVGAAFLFAFQIPNLFRRLLGEGALTAAVVPVLADKQAKEGKIAAFKFLNYVVGRLLPGMLGLTFLGVGAALCWALLATEPRQQAAAELTAYCLPYMPLICMAALFTSAVNLSGRFGLAEIASALLNLSMIVALAVFGLNFATTDMGRARWLCAGALVGGALQLLIPMWGLRQAGWRAQPAQGDAVAWQTLRTAFIPAALGAGIHQINFLLSRCLAFNVGDNSLTYYYLANRIVELPIGLFSASIATVLFPALALAFAEKNHVALARNYARGVRLILAINIAAAMGLIVLSAPMVRLLFEFGKFTIEDCERTRDILVYFALAMPFYALISLATRALNVAGQTSATFRAALHAVAVNVVGSLLAVYGDHGIRGLAVANGLATVWQYLVLRRQLAERSPEFLAENSWRPLGQVLLGSLVLGVIAYQVNFWGFLWLQDWLPIKLALGVAMLVATTIAAAWYAWILCAWNYPEKDMVLGFVDRGLRLLRLRRSP